MFCSYNIDNADSIESQSVRLKSCLYHEETASTCSVFDQLTASRSTLSLQQPSKLGKMLTQQSEKHSRETDRREHGDVTEGRCDVLSGNSKQKTRTSDVTKPRYCQCLINSGNVQLSK